MPSSAVSTVAVVACGRYAHNSRPILFFDTVAIKYSSQEYARCQMCQRRDGRRPVAS